MPVGSPAVHVYVTLLAKVVPPTGEINIVVEVDCPGFAGGGFVRVAGTLKSGASVTIVSATVVVAVGAPGVPVIVTVVGPPAAAEPLAVSVSVLVPAVGFGLNNAVTPLGRTDVARLTLPVNPPTSVTVMVLAPPAPPAAIVTLLGAADSVKPGVELTVRATVVVAVSVPEVPVTKENAGCRPHGEGNSGGCGQRAGGAGDSHRGRPTSSRRAARRQRERA